MPDFRAFCPSLEEEPHTLTLDPAESHHLVVVNRAQSGAPVVVFDGQGREWDCELTVDSKRAAELTVRASRPVSVRPHHFAIAQALPKGGTFETIVRQATEIGVSEIHPLLTERTQVHLDASRSTRKQDKWRTTALEAAKQCGNPWLPTIAPLQPYTDWLTTTDDYELKLIASLHSGATPLGPTLSACRDRLGRLPRRVLWAIGPEGDFSPAEMTQALDAGFQPITLGPLVLRCDTAATYALSILSHELLCL